MVWRTYTLDGRVLEVALDGGSWVAMCDGHTTVAATAVEALRGVVIAEATTSINGNGAANESWIAAQAARLETERVRLERRAS
jgi:hypothetical protein